MSLIYFYTAIYFDKEDVLKYALARYKDINNRLYSDEYGLTLLTYACKLSNVRLARILLEHGISVNGLPESITIHIKYIRLWKPLPIIT